MRIATYLIASTCSLLVTFAACSDKKADEAEPFDTLQACFDEHHNEESLSVHDALVVCCVDHPIAGVHPSCGDTKAACVTHVRGAIDASVTDPEIDTICTDYIAQK